MKIYSNRKQDGFGSVYVSCMCCFARARNDGAIYRHTHFVDLNGKHLHHNPNPRNNDFDYIMNDFTGLISDSSDIDKSVTPSYGHGSGVQGGFPITREHMNSIMNPSVVDELRNMYYSNTKPTPISCDVAVHIRRGDIAQKSQNGVYRSDRCLPLDVYIKKIEELQSNLNKRLKIIIFSEGKTEDFEELFTIQNVDIELHLNEDLCITFHSMVKAPILVLSMSMLSIAAGILNENEVHYRNWNAFAPLSRWNVY
jgi:hypothetical protein